MIRCALLVLACALAVAACVRVVELTPPPDAHTIDAHPVGSDGGSGLDSSFPGDAFTGIDAGLLD